MSIFDETRERDSRRLSADRALELFTNRDELICLFQRYVNDDPPRNQLLYVHGTGGNGKSLLLRL